MASQLDRIEQKVDRLHACVIGDGGGTPPLMQRVASLEEERGRRRWTLRALIGVVLGLVGQWIYSLLHGRQ